MDFTIDELRFLLNLLSTHSGQQAATLSDRFRELLATQTALLPVDPLERLQSYRSRLSDLTRLMRKTPFDSPEAETLNGEVESLIQQIAVTEDEIRASRI